MTSASPIPYSFSHTTERLLLRGLTMNDHSIWKETHLNLPKSDNPWAIQPRTEDKLTRKAYRQWQVSTQEDWQRDQNYYFAAFERETHHMIGQISLMDISRAIFQNAYVGYTVFTPYWRKGYGTEMLNGAIDIAFQNLKLHRIEAGIDPQNTPSICLVENIGFRFEGLSRNRLYFKDQWRDMRIYAFTTEDHPRLLN